MRRDATSRSELRLRAVGLLASVLAACGGESEKRPGSGPDSGPDTGSGAMAGTGGNSKAGTGGAGSGGAPLGPELTGVDALTPAPCKIAAEVTAAEAIPTVGIATFTADLEGATHAIIQFGETVEYTLEAPVDWPAPEHRTLLLGMPADTEVHYRVVVFAGDTACPGPDETFRTGTLPMGSPSNLTPTRGPSTVAPAPGFIIAQTGNYAYVIDRRGRVVWSYRFPFNVVRALLSWDARYMIARDIGPFNAGSGGNIQRVALDGTGEMKLDVAGGTHHDVTAIPSGIAYPAKPEAGACDSLYVADLDGSNSRAVVDLGVVFGKFKNGSGAAAMEECHVNAIRYYADIDAFSLSDREKDAIAFVSSSGEILGSIGAEPIEATPNHVVAEGADSTASSPWRVQHGHDWYENDKLVVWSNGTLIGGMSRLLHYTLSGATATLDWQYSATGNSPTLSDAQHLPNGNFLGTASQTGAVHEIDPQRQLVQSFSGLSRGYTSHRTTFYGRPPGR